MLKIVKCSSAICALSCSVRIIEKMRPKRTFSGFIAWRDEEKHKLSPLKFAFSPLSNSKLLNAICWKCQADSYDGSLFCSKCRTIQKPIKDTNLFQLFGLQIVYDVDETLLSRKFKELQKVLHPDKFSLHSPEELSIAEEFSSLVNKAYSTLRNPWSRGVYLLKLSGVEFNEETVVDDPELLMTVMERNESISEAENATEIQKIDEINRRDIESVTKLVSENFKRGDLDQAKQLLIHLKYFTNIDGRLSEKKLNFGLE